MLDIPILTGVAFVYFLLGHQINIELYSLGLLSGATAMQIIIGNLAFGLGGMFGIL